MGGNGSAKKGSTNTEEGRKWHTIFESPSGIKYIQKKNSKEPAKLPEESHSINAIYATWNKPDKQGIVTLKGVAKYGPDNKKIIEIHTTDHKGLGAHYHHWKNGSPIDVNPLTPVLKQFLDDVINAR